MCLETRAGGRELEAERGKLSVFAPDSSLVLGFFYLAGLFFNGRFGRTASQIHPLGVQPSALSHRQLLLLRRDFHPILVKSPDLQQ